MANIKSAKKRVLVNQAKAANNKARNTALKTAIKKVMVAVSTGDKAAAQAALTPAISAIDKAYTKGIFHKNAAARKKSSLVKLVNKM